MPDKEKLMNILRDQYGITSAGELDEALRKQRRIDISAFVSGEDGKGEKDEPRSR